MPNMWDERFSRPEFVYGEAPNAFVKENAHLLKPGGEILAAGDGEGRNSVWLARQGFRVVNVDYSREGLKKTRILAAKHGVNVRTICADLSKWNFPREQFDGVVATFLHLPPDIRSTVHRNFLKTLKPGGRIILEAFHKSQLGLTSGGPKDPALLYEVEALKQDFTEAGEVTCEQVEKVLDEGPGHQGVARVVDCLVLKKNG